MTHPNDNPIVFIVDDDPDVRESLRCLLQSVNLNVVTYAGAQEFLDNYYRPRQPCCLLLDACMPDVDGLQLHQKLRQRNINIPVVLMTGHSDVALAVSALKQGVFDFIEKPCNDQLLIDSVQNALDQSQNERDQHAYHRDVNERFASLTTREQEVMEKIVQGLSNQSIAEDLDVSRKTVEVHRARVMEKMHAKGLSELMRMAIIIGLIKEYANEGDTETSL